MDLHRLHHFLAVVEHGSIGRAAATLNLSQPALSNSIRRLEDNLEARLFDRGPHGVTPTVFGESLAERVRLIFHEVRNAEQELAALRGLHTGHVTIGAGPSIIAEILPAAIMNLQRKRQAFA